MIQAYSIYWKLFSFSRHTDECLFSPSISIVFFLCLMGLHIFAEELKGHFETRLDLCWMLIQKNSNLLP